MLQEAKKLQKPNTKGKSQLLSDNNAKGKKKWKKD